MQLRIHIVALSLSIALSLQHSFSKSQREINFINDAVVPGDLNLEYYEIDRDVDKVKVRVPFNNTEYHSDSNGKQLCI